MSVRVPSRWPQTNQVAELYAIALVAARAPPFAPLHILSDSKYVVEGITRWVYKWEAQGWIGVANKDLFKDALAWLRARSARTTLKWVKGHAGTAGNEAADALAREGAEKPATVSPLPPAPQQFLLRGAKLTCMTQKLAYKGIGEWSVYEGRETSRRITEQVVAMILHQTKISVPVGRLWRSLKSKDVPRKMRDFLWKALHGAQKVGAFWRHISGYEIRAQCIVCGAEESMEHILVECEADASKEIRRLLMNIIRKRTKQDIQLTFGLMVGVTAMSLSEVMKKNTAYLDRFMRICVMESTYLIWKIRCERVIERGDDSESWHSPHEARSRWYAAINRRLTMDKAMTSRKLGMKATKKHIVLETWRGVLSGGANDVDDWLGMPGVLVGTLDRIYPSSYG
ncbi:hypothetical protein C8Q76DRAFT_672304 [Earliella scabrosa]|nr:hypothetical protein C8Q76DRAFT_672304 [Earliella scabrosa]